MSRYEKYSQYPPNSLQPATESTYNLSMTPSIRRLSMNPAQIQLDVEKLNSSTENVFKAST